MGFAGQEPGKREEVGQSEIEEGIPGVAEEEGGCSADRWVNRLPTFPCPAVS